MRNVLVGLVLVVLSGAAAQEAEPPPPLPYAYAYRLGSGIYAVDGRTVQIYRVPIRFGLPAPDDRRWRIELSAPVTLGFFDFELADVIESGLPERIGTASLVPGVTVPVRLDERWTLSPGAEAGLAWESSADSRAYVGAAILTSLGLYAHGPAVWRLGQQLALVGQSLDGADNNDHFVELKLGVEYRRPLGAAIAGHELDWGLFTQWHGYRYSEQQVAAGVTTRTLAEQFGIRRRWELGVTFGPIERWKILKIPIPRLGLSVEYGKDFDAVRLVFGVPF